MKIKELEEIGLKCLSAERFIWELWEANWWSWIDCKCVDFNNVYMPKIEKYIIGFCDGSRVPIRPRNGSYAIMLEVENTIFWFHMEQETIDTYFLDKDMWKIMYD